MINPPHKITKNHLCIKCGSKTEQVLIPSQNGCDWQCSVCKNQLLAYTFADMTDIVQKYIFNISTVVQDKPAIPNNYKVYLKCDLAIDKEMEAIPAAVIKHVQLIGKLPQINKPLCTSVAGVIVPYGEVVRITTGQTNAS
jgi:hypothetical protein